jgi:hypothetical protein
MIALNARRSPWASFWRLARRWQTCGNIFEARESEAFASLTGLLFFRDPSTR